MAWSDAMAVAERAAFATAVGGPSDTMPLLPTAIAIARILQRGETWSGADELLDRLGRAATEACTAGDAVGRTEQLFAVLRERDFRGDDIQYEDVRNSLMDRVLERRRGLPITLSILAVHLAESLAIPLHGIGFPGHFLVGVFEGAADELPTLFDPFLGGTRIDIEEAARRLAKVESHPIAADDPELRAHLRPAVPRLVISRVLMNLQKHYAIRGAHDRVLDVIDLLRMVHPEIDGLQRDQERAGRRLRQLN